MNDNYVFPVGVTEKDRLLLLNQICNEESISFIGKSITRDGSFLEIGCGHGQLLKRLSQNYGQLQLHGVDVSAEQIRLATLNTAGYDITLKTESVYTLSNSIKVDTVYCRFLLMHLTDPVLALKNMMSLVENGGKLLIEEPIMCKNFCYPENETYHKFVNLFLKLGESLGCDYNIGVKARNIALNMGFRVTSISLSQPVFSHKSQKEIMVSSLVSVSDKMVKQGIVSSHEIRNIISDLNKLTKDEKYIFALSPQVQLVGPRVRKLHHDAKC